jgi:hypothetical protein
VHDAIDERVDALLAKISEHGEASLTDNDFQMRVDAAAIELPSGKHGKITGGTMTAKPPPLMSSTVALTRASSAPSSPTCRVARSIS